jgi:hypothetical protein
LLVEVGAGAGPVGVELTPVVFGATAEPPREELYAALLGFIWFAWLFAFALLLP